MLPELVRGLSPVKLMFAAFKIPDFRIVVWSEDRSRSWASMVPPFINLVVSAKPKA